MSFTTKWLLSHHGVWAGAAGVDLVTHHVVEFDHMHHADRCTLLEWLTAQAIVELALAIARNASLFKLILDGIGWHTVEWRCGDLVAECSCSHTEVRLKELAKVHATWHTKRVEDDINRSTIS